MSATQDLIDAAKNGDLEKVRRLTINNNNVNYVDEDGKTLLYWAAIMGHVELCKHLISVCNNIDNANKLGMTPLYWAAKNGDLGICKLLVEGGADINKSDNCPTPLHAAVSNGHVVVCKCLVEGGADISKIDNVGRTPRQVAECYFKREVIDYLKSVEEERAEIMFVFKRAHIDNDEKEDDDDNTEIDNETASTAAEEK